VLLHRFAAVYPEMDLATQSRYGLMMKALGEEYPGKIVNHIWEADVMSTLTEAYDACWETIDGDAVLQREAGQTGRQIRAFIEANLLEDAVDAYYAGKIRGNFGMHQGTLARLAVVREYGDQQKWLDSLMNNAGSNPSLLGLNYALYNLIYRDGAASETSVHYNSIWLERISQYAPLLEKNGRHPFEIPKLRRIYDAALAMICARGQNPNIGDGGSVWGGIIRPDLPSYQTAYLHYHDPRVAQYLAAFGATGDAGFTSFESLLHPPIEAPRAATGGPTTRPTTGPGAFPSQPTRLLAGYGMGFLNNRRDSVEVALYYGLRAGHGHFDRLNIELFADDQPMVPDLGYPDGANEFLPGIFTWSRNTIAHNTVTVDAHRQTGNRPGTVNLFADGHFARAMDISGDGTYPQCDAYRRAVIMVDCDPEQSYFVDVFTVRGGKEHDYSLHGPPGTFETIGGKWSDPQTKGTLAGENVEVGQIYDDPKLGAPGYKGGYSSYTGSGFQHLYHVRRHEGGDTVAQWSHAKDPSAKLRIRVLDQPGQQLILANARVSPIKFPEVLTYLIARRQQQPGDGRALGSRFVSVIEPFRGEPLIKDVRQVELSGGGTGTAIEVRRSDGGSNLIVYDPGQSRKTTKEGNLSTDARVAVVRRDRAGQVTGRFFAGGTYMAVGDDRLDGSARTGKIVSTDPASSQIRIRPDQPQASPEEFIGRVVHFQNDLRRTEHTITSAKRDGDEIVLTASDDLIVGRARIDEVSDDALTTRTALPLAAVYRGTTLAGPRFEPLARVSHVDQGKIVLATPVAKEHSVARGEDVWLVNVGPGDRFELPAVVDVGR
jgi:hypothetical protein